MVPMSEDAHLGGDSHDALPAAKPEADSGVHIAMASPPPVAKSTKSVTIKMLPGSRIWKKVPIETFGPTTVTIKSGESVVFQNADVGMAPSVFGEKGEFASPMHWQHVAVWGGLRGALALALALSLTTAFPYREQILSLTFGVDLAHSSAGTYNQAPRKNPHTCQWRRRKSSVNVKVASRPPDSCLVTAIC